MPNLLFENTVLPSILLPKDWYSKMPPPEVARS